VRRVPGCPDPESLRLAMTGANRRAAGWDDHPGQDQCGLSLSETRRNPRPSRSFSKQVRNANEAEVASVWRGNGAPSNKRITPHLQRALFPFHDALTWSSDMRSSEAGLRLINDLPVSPNIGEEPQDEG
jgi:hypothetical protein